MEIVTINNINYVPGDFILKNAPIYSHRCRSSRELIKTKNIDETKYIFAKLINDTWIPSEGKSIKFDKIMIKEDIIKDIPELNNSNQIISNEDGIEQAPEIINLNDVEKFKDNEGNILDIETRGVRESDKIYFKVKDVSNGFSMINLYKNITDKDTLYKINKDYKYFMTNISHSVVINSDKNTDNADKNSDKTNQKSNATTTIKKELFLTYEGMLRVLFVSRNNKTSSFIKWATEKLFTIQMGSEEKKEELGTEILNVNIKSYRAVFKSYASKFPCIYLLELGTVKNLRDTFNIQSNIDSMSNLCVYKYGFTDDLERRLIEHNNDYGKLKNVNIFLSIFNIIDVKYTSEAENDLRQFFKNLNKVLNIEGRKELIILNSEELKTVKREYKHIGNDYIGSTQGLQDKIKELELKIIELQNEIKDNKNKYELDLLKKDMIIQEQQSQIKYKDLELEFKDLKLSNYVNN